MSLQRHGAASTGYLHSGVEMLSACVTGLHSAELWHTITSLCVSLLHWQHFRRGLHAHVGVWDIPGAIRDPVFCTKLFEVTPAPPKHNESRANQRSRLHRGTENPAVRVTSDKVYCLRDDKCEVTARVVKTIFQELSDKGQGRVLLETEGETTQLDDTMLDMRGYYVQYE